jgi:hypothetical protein
MGGSVTLGITRGRGRLLIVCREYAVRRIHGSQEGVKENGAFIGAMGDSDER